MAIKTPNYDLSCFSDVYEPSEDSFLLIDALEEDLKCLQRSDPLFVLEIGSGSGIVSTALASVLKNSLFFSTDVNFQACLATRQTGLKNNIAIEPICMDLVSNFHSGCLFDIILFNPPYVVTDSSETRGRGLNKAWAGGIKGREIIDRLIPCIPKILHRNGMLYLLLLKENNPSEVIEMFSNFNCKCVKIMERKILGEHLYVFKFFK